MEKKTRFGFLLEWILFFLLFPASVQANAQVRSILYINSYHNGYQWSDSEFDGIRSTFEQSRYKVDLQVEYMDTKKFKSDQVTAHLLSLYRKKFSTKRFDVIIVSDDDAFRFALDYRPELFPGVPLVFCGVNALTGDELRFGNLTGVVESFDLTGTIDIVLKLHPEKKRMVVVGDTSTAGRAIKQQIMNLVSAYQGRLDVDYWVQLNLVEVQNRVAQLSDDSFLFFIPYCQMIGNSFYSAEEVMAAISVYSSVPIYTAWEFLLGHGAVGGSLLSGYDHGRAAAKQALKILEGEDADSIPVQMAPAGSFIFDYNVMERLKIDKNMLPERATIINVPNPFYRLPRELFWTLIVSFLLLFLILIALILNMVARRKIELKIKEQLSFQEILIDTIPQLVSWKDENGLFVGANLTFASFFGLQKVSELVNKTTRDVMMDHEYVSWAVHADDAVVNRNESFRKVRRRIVDSNGTDQWLDVNKVPLKDQNGRTTGVLTVAENVTRENNLEKQLLQSQKMEAIGTLAGGISHDFNNILTSIINSAELAVGDVPADSQTRKDLERVLKAARRGGRVVKQILSFSRPSQEGFRSTDLKSVITEAITLMEVSMPGNVKIRSYIAPGLVDVYADPTQIHQAVMNLCTNAFQELRRTGGEIQLRLEEEQLDVEEAGYMGLQSGTFIKISVIDDGPGITPEVIDKIFDPFFSSKDKAEGTGLGLTVVLGIVKGHGGSLRVKSDVGEGTAFEIFLPRVASQRKGVGKELSIDTVKGGRILFVEDDRDQLQTAERLLTGIGFYVEAISSGRDAVALITAGAAFDLMITDYDMPELNGVEMVQKISRWAPALPVLMVSGREDAVSAAVGVDAIKKVIIKPYDKKELIWAISLILEKG